MRVIIVGAGVGGLSLATALYRRGVDVTVFERSGRATLGAGIQLSPNGVHILRELGADVAGRAVAAEAITYHRHDGTPLVRIPHGNRCVDRFGAPYLLTHRRDLQEALRSCAPHHLVRYEHTVAVVASTDDGAEVVLRNGERHLADLVVGADGVHSAVRSAVIGDDEVYSGFGVYRTVVDADRFPRISAGREVRFWLGDRGHVTCYPIRQGNQIHVSAVRRMARPDAAGRSSTAELLHAYRGWDPQLLRLLATAADVTRWALVDRPAPARLHAGRVVLLGDAAHPTLPYLSQGANQALEDVSALATALGEARDVPEALNAYVERRLARVQLVHRAARERGAEFHLPAGPARQRRDARLAASEPSHLDWLYGRAPVAVPAPA